VILLRLRRQGMKRLRLRKSRALFLIYSISDGKTRFCDLNVYKVEVFFDDMRGTYYG
jgi:hypothetical protein